MFLTDLRAFLIDHSSVIRITVEIILSTFAIEGLKKYRSSVTILRNPDLGFMLDLYTVYYIMLFLLFIHHPIVRVLFDLGLIENPCLFVKPVLFTVTSIMFYFHLMSAIDWLELACNGYQIVEINQKPVIRVLIAMSIVEGIFIAYTDGANHVNDVILQRNPAEYYTNNESTCFDPLTGTMRVLMVKAAVISVLSILAYGMSMMSAVGTLAQSKRGSNMHMIGFRHIFKMLQFHCGAGLLSNVCCTLQVVDYLSEQRNLFFFGYVPIVAAVGVFVNPVVYRFVV